MEELGAAVAAVSGEGGAAVQGHWSSGLDDTRGLGVGPVSYVAIALLSNRLPAVHPSTLVRSHDRESQVLIDKARKMLEKMAGQVGQGLASQGHWEPKGCAMEG